tara:strand:+ start:1000 stop:1152 length:153 start_codon:yes stop_codon:yes gene_type:complete
MTYSYMFVEVIYRFRPLMRQKLIHKGKERQLKEGEGKQRKKEKIAKRRGE